MKSINVNELLGAKLFQKIVFKVEELKYIVLNKIFPNYEEKYEKELKNILERNLSKEEDNEKRRLLIENYKKEILLFRKENVNRKNRNYHMDMDNTSDILTYLNKNKLIHLNGLIKNVFMFLVSIPLIIFGSGFLLTTGYIMLSLNLISTIINFECVNLQNYNIKRITAAKEKLDKYNERRKNNDLKKYGDVSLTVSKELKKDIDIPSPEIIIDSIKTKEELEQMKSLLLREVNKRNIENDIVERRVLK